MPEPDLPLEVEHTDHDLALRVVTGHGQGPTVAQHGAAGVRHSHHTTVLTHAVLKNKHNMSLYKTPVQCMATSEAVNNRNFVHFLVLVQFGFEKFSNRVKKNDRMVEKLQVLKKVLRVCFFLFFKWFSQF